MIEIIPLSPTVGAEVQGIDLSCTLDDELVAELLTAWTEWKVLFFRHQHLTREQHLRIADYVGGKSDHGTFGRANEDANEATDDDPLEVGRFQHAQRTIIPGMQQLVHDRDQGRGLDNEWHTDSSFWPEPPIGAVLRSIEVPLVGGDTLFADMSAAYDGMSTTMQTFLQPLRAVHDVAISGRVYLTPERLAETQKQFPPVEHPLIRTHPVSGKRAIYAAAPTTSHIMGLTRSESDELLRFLFQQARVPEYQCRIRWERDCVVIWDNRVLQHYPVYDYWPHRRVMERVLLHGEKPI